MEHVERLRYEGVLFRGYLDAGRHLVRLMLPGVLVNVPLTALSLVGLTVATSDSMAVVNQRFQVIGTSDTPLLAWTFVLAGVALAGQLVVFPATVIIAVGHLVRRPVSPVEALRATVRRLPSLLVLLLVGTLAFGAAVAAGAGVLLATEQAWLAIVVLVVAAYAAMPGLLAVPGIVLHGRSALGSIRLAYRLTRRGEPPPAWTLAFGVVLIPGAVTRAVESGLHLLPGPLATLGNGLVGTVLVLAVAPFQAAVVARQFLKCITDRLEADDSDLEFGLPDGPPPQPMRPWTLPAALLPGLLFGGVVLVNPFGWLDITETNVTESWRSVEFPDTLSRSSNPRMSSSDLQAMHTGRGAALSMVMDGFENHSRLLTCTDPSCRETSFVWTEPHREGISRDTAASTRLPDGRLLLTTWTSRSLGLLTCEATTCARSSGAIATARTRANWVGVALAARRGGGPVLAYAEAEPPEVDPEDEPTHDLLSFIFCADTSCARPERRQVARLESIVYSSDMYNLAVAIGPRDHPVAARFDPDSGQIQVISCLDAACYQPYVTSPVPPGPMDPLDRPWTGGLSMAVRPDGRPAIAYRDSRDHVNKLLDCRTPDCAQADVRTLGAGSKYHAVPALTLDRAGRPLVAFESREGQRLMLAICTSRCESIPVSTSKGGLGRLAMTTNAEGDPTIAWIDHGDSFSLNVTTPRNLRSDGRRPAGRRRLPYLRRRPPRLPGRPPLAGRGR